jgi:hypothetical protein
LPVATIERAGICMHAGKAAITNEKDNAGVEGTDACGEN